MHESRTLMPAVLEHLDGRYHELSAYGLCGLVWGAAVLGDLTVPAFQAANQLLDKRNLHEFTSRVTSYCCLQSIQSGHFPPC